MLTGDRRQTGKRKLYRYITSHAVGQLSLAIPPRVDANDCQPKQNGA